MAINKDNVLDESWNNVSLLEIRTALQELLSDLGDSIEAATGGKPVGISLSAEPGDTALGVTVTLSNGDTLEAEVDLQDFISSMDIAVEVVNHLRSSASDKALSAAQGLELDRKSCVLLEHMHCAANYSPSVNEMSLNEERVFYEPVGKKIYHSVCYGTGGGRNVSTDMFTPRFGVLYFDKETSTWWRWLDGDMVMVSNPWCVIGTATTSSVQPSLTDGSSTLYYYTDTKKLNYCYRVNGTTYSILHDPDKSKVYSYPTSGGSKAVRWNGTQWVDVGIDTSTLQPRLLAGTGISINSNNKISVETGSVEANEDKPVSGKDVKEAIDVATPTIDPISKNWVVGGTVTDKPSRGEKGEKGDQGDTLLVDGNTDVISLIVNDLSTGGGGNIMSAEMGLVLRRELTKVNTSLTRLYTKLANLAFWDATDQADAEPTALNFNVPTKTITFDLTGVGSNVIVKIDNDAVINNYPTDVGTTHTLTIEAAEDYVLNNDVAVEVNGVVQTLTNVGGVYSLQVTVNDNMAIEVVGTATRFWYIAPKDDEVVGGSVVRYGMQQGRSINGVNNNGSATSGLLDDNTTPVIILSPAGVPTSTKIFTAKQIPGQSYAQSDPGNAAPYYFPTGGKRYLYLTISGVDYASAVFAICIGCYGNAVIGQTYTTPGQAVTGCIGRTAYVRSADLSGTVWKFDLNDFATQQGASAGDITYVKFVFTKVVNGSNVDTRTWYDAMNLKYRFSDD